MTLLDLTLALWIACVATAVYAGLPHAVGRLCGRRGPKTIPLIAGLLVWTVAGMTLLDAVRLVNPVTVVGLHAAYAIVVFAAVCGRFDCGMQRLLRTIAMAYERLARPRRPCSRPTTGVLRRLGRAALAVPEGVPRPHLAACAALAVLVAVSRVGPALLEARLFDPAAYDQLYLVRRLFDEASVGVTLGGPLWIGAIATLAAGDPAYVVRFLPPLLACVVTWALWRTMMAQDRSEAAVVALACWWLAGSGAAAESPWAAVLSRQHAATGEYVAALLLFAGIWESRGNRHGRSAWPALAAVLFAPPLGVVAAIALAFPGRMRAGVIAAAWVGVCVSGLRAGAPPALVGAAATLPVALAFAAGIVWAALPRAVQLPQGSTAAACGTLLALAGFTIVPPARVIESDTSARQALRIARESPRGEWTIVARSAPLVRGFDDGRLMPLPVFTACARGAVLPECRAVQRTVTYVFVHKQPEIGDLAHEQAALVAAERLAHSLKGARIDYEDDALRIYRVPPQPWPL
jgi:hypothetical protein